MRRVADRVVDALLRWARWYRPEDIAARERRTEDGRRLAIAARLWGEAPDNDKLRQDYILMAKRLRR